MIYGSARPGFEDFCRALSLELGIPEGRLRSCDRLVADLDLDELKMAEMVGTLSQWNPYFQMPDQMEIGVSGFVICITSFAI
jgi:hypothetical protein